MAKTRVAEPRRRFLIYDDGRYPQSVQTDHEIWRSLPKEVRAATIEAILAFEKQLASAKKTSPEEKEFNNDLRAGLMLAVGVLQEAADGPGAQTATSNRTGNA